jgi:hypothetical protein
MRPVPSTAAHQVQLPEKENRENIVTESVKFLKPPQFVASISQRCLGLWVGQAIDFLAGR